MWTKKKNYHDFLNVFLISILITILTQTDALFCVNLKHISKGNQLDLSQRAL